MLFFFFSQETNAQLAALSASRSEPTKTLDKLFDPNTLSKISDANTKLAMTTFILNLINATYHAPRHERDISVGMSCYRALVFLLNKETSIVDDLLALRMIQSFGCIALVEKSLVKESDLLKLKSNAGSKEAMRELLSILI